MAVDPSDPARRHPAREDPPYVPRRPDCGGGMRVTLTGAGGLIGTRLVQALRARGDDVTVLSRAPARTGAALGVAAQAWQPLDGPAPAGALAGRDAVVH